MEDCPTRAWFSTGPEISTALPQMAGNRAVASPARCALKFMCARVLH
jgi:hypothetical protein